jgi:hypothetical protein
MDFFNIRDKSIPNNDIDSLKKYLDKLEINIQNTRKITFQIEKFLSTAIFHNNSIIISILNLFIREYNIIIDKKNILENIYWAKIRDKQANNKYTRECCTYYDFCESDYLEYLAKYPDLFEYY